jgi:ankyrin repeat protein
MTARTLFARTTAVRWRAAFMLVAFGWSSLAFCGEIHDAARNGFLSTVQELIKKDPDLVSSKDESGATPLLVAAAKGHKDVVQLLLANKADVDAKANNSRTPLHMAAANGHKDVVELLLANFADVSAKDSEGMSPVDLATKGGHEDIVELLRKDENGATPLLVAAAKGHKDVVQLLLANKADVNAKANNGRTPLHMAAANGHKDVVELLLANNADVSAKDGEGMSPVDLATEGGHEDIVELLRERGGQQTEEFAWSQAVANDTIKAYLDFSRAYPNSAHIQIATGTVRGRYWETMGQPEWLGGKVVTDLAAEGVLVTVAKTEAFKMLPLEEAIALGVIGYKPAGLVPSGTELKTPVTTFDVTSMEMQGSCFVKHTTSSNKDLAAGLMIEPKDILDASVVLSADGKRLLAWDIGNAKVADHADTSQATYPNSARKKVGGYNPESQRATYSQKFP